jgi:hypothetical protein
MAAERTIRKKGAKNKEITEALKEVMKFIVANRKEQKQKEMLVEQVQPQIPLIENVQHG